MERPIKLDVPSTFTDTTVSGGNVHFGHQFRDIINYEGGNGRSTQDLLRSRALQALFWTDPEVDRTKADDRTRAGRTPGTCEWVLENQDFKAWEEGDAPQLLLVTGEPGIGKTVLATFLVDHLKKRAESEGSEFAYFFCMNAEARQSTGLGILRGLLLLLLRNKPALCHHLLKDFSVKRTSLFDSIETLWPVFQSVIADDSLGNLVLQIDGLDECEAISRDLLVSRLGGLARNGGCGKMKLVITSRVVRAAINLASDFSEATQKLTMDISKVNKDLQRFIEYEVEDIANKCRWDADLKAEVTEHVKNRHEGTFVWVSLALKTASRKQPYQVLEELSRLPDGLQKLYARILHEIDREDRDVVYRVLVLVIGAKRPFSIDELTIALHFYPDQAASAAVRRKLPTQKEMDQYQHWVHTYAILLRMEESHVGRVLANVFHLTLKEFLTGQQLPAHVSRYHIDQDQAGEIILAISTAYLLSEQLNAIAIDAERLRDVAIDRYKYRDELSAQHKEPVRHEELTPRKKTLQLLKDRLLHRARGRRKYTEERKIVHVRHEETLKFEMCKAWPEVQERQLLLLIHAHSIQRTVDKTVTRQQVRSLIFDLEGGPEGCYAKDDFLYVLRVLTEDFSLAAPGAINGIWSIMRAMQIKYDFAPVARSGLHDSLVIAAKSGRRDMLETVAPLSPLGSLQPRIILTLAMRTLVPGKDPPVAQDEEAFELLSSPRG